MASPLVDISHGIIIDFGTSNFTAEITDVTPPGSSRETVNVSHQGSTSWEEWLPSALADNGELGMTIHFNPDTNPPITSAPETVMITFPSGSNWSFSGFMINYTPGAPHKDKMTAEVTVKVNGAISRTAGS